MKKIIALSLITIFGCTKRINSGLYGMQKGKPEKLGINGGTELMTAVSKRRIGRIKAILSWGEESQINQTTLKGWTALMNACIEGDEEIIQLLLDGGASVDIVNKDGMTAFTIACSHGHISAAQLLLNSGANINHFNKNRWTALMSACKENNEEVVSFLLENGSNITLVNNNYQTARDLATKKSIRKMLKRRKKELEAR